MSHHAGEDPDRAQNQHDFEIGEKVTHAGQKWQVTKHLTKKNEDDAWSEDTQGHIRGHEIIAKDLKTKKQVASGEVLPCGWDNQGWEEEKVEAEAKKVETKAKKVEVEAKKAETEPEAS